MIMKHTRIVVGGPGVEFPGEINITRISVSAEDCPHLNTPKKKKERENAKRIFGESDAFYRSMFLGEFTPRSKGAN
jgi:hypothetical protein